MMIYLCADYNSGFNPNFRLPSLFNPNNINMKHSISFMSGISSNNQGFYQSMYTNHILYTFNSKLNLKLDLNFVNDGSITFNKGFNIEGNNDNASKILPNFSLNYKPTDNTSIILEFRSYGDGNQYFNNYKRW